MVYKLLTPCDGAQLEHQMFHVPLWHLNPHNRTYKSSPNTLSCVSDGRYESVLQKILWSHPMTYRSLGRVEVTAWARALTTLYIFGDFSLGKFVSQDNLTEMVKEKTINYTQIDFIHEVAVTSCYFWGKIQNREITNQSRHTDLCEVTSSVWNFFGSNLRRHSNLLPRERGIRDSRI